MMKKITLLILLIIPFIGFSQDVEYLFESDGDKEGWEQSGVTITVAGGAMEVKINDPAQGYQLTRSEGGLNLAEANYVTLRMVVKNNAFLADGTTPFTSFDVFSYDTGSTNGGAAAKENVTIPGGAGYQTIDASIPINPDNGGFIDRLAIRFKAGSNSLAADSNLDFQSITIVSSSSVATSYNGFVQNADFEDKTGGLTPWSIETATSTSLSFTDTPADVQNGSQAAKITFDGTLSNSSIKVWNNFTYVFSSPIPETYSVQLSRFQKSSDVSTDVQVVFRMHKTGGGNKDFYQGSKTNTSSYNEEVDDRVLDDGDVADVTYDSMEIFFRCKGGSVGSEVFIDNITTSMKDDLGGDIPLNTEKVSFKEDASISLYPNPAQDRVTVNAPNRIEKVEVFSILGKKAFTSKKNTLDISSLAPGMYIAKIHQEGEIISTKRFVKQ